MELNDKKSKVLGLLYRSGLLRWVLSLCPLCFCCDFPHRPHSRLLQLFECPKRNMAMLCANFKWTFISLLFFPVRCFIITNSNKAFFFFFFITLRYSVAFVLPASAVTSEDCNQGAKCAGPRVRAAEYTNLRKHRQWIANDTQNKTRKKTFTQKTTKELYRHWIGFLYTLILLNCVWQLTEHFRYWWTQNKSFFGRYGGELKKIKILLLSFKSLL